MKIDLRKILGEKNGLAYVGVAVFILIFIFLSIGRHDGLKSYLNDLGNYDQAIWNTLQGRLLEISVSMLDTRYYLGGHFSPILLLFVPLYALWATPKWFLIVQAVSVGLSALPVYWLAREKTKSANLGLIFLASYLLYPVLHNALLYDFHEVVFATAFASFAFYFLEKGNDRGFIFCSIFLAASQEHLPLLVFMLGLYAFFIKKRWRFGTIVSATSLIYFFLVVLVFMPYFSESGKPDLLIDHEIYPSRYAWLGSNLPEIAKNILTHPLAVAKVIFSYGRLKYLFLLVAPTFSLAVFSWPIVIVLPIVLTYLLSSNGMTYNISFYHSAILAPFVFFSAIITYQRWFISDAFFRKFFAASVLLSSFVSAVLFGLTPLSDKYTLKDYFPSDHAKRVGELKKMVPPEASLSVQHNLGPHFSQRSALYRFPIKKEEADYVLLDTFDPYEGKEGLQFQFEYALQISYAELISSVESMKNSPDYETVFQEDGYFIFKRKR